jgi:hypothetical protein
MNEGFDDMIELDPVNKLKRRVIETPLNLQTMDPLKLVHNKLARMVQHDISMASAKVQPYSVKQSGLKVLADTDAIHKKLFNRMEAGDGPKDSGTEVFKKSRDDVGRRKQIITI